MTGADPKATLQRYLQDARDAVLWKLDGVSEYDVRRPLTSTATNLLGLVKHLAGVEFGYFGATFGREPDEPMLHSWFDAGAHPNVDMWATPAESRAEIIAFYRRAWQHSDRTIELFDLDEQGTVAHWPPERRAVTLHRILVHVISDTQRHAGHADIVRELIDGTAGMRVDAPNLPERDAAWWREFCSRVEADAREAHRRSPAG